MSNIIQLLERMGQDANLQDQQAIASEIAQADISTELKQALAEQDAAAIHNELDLCPDVHCLMFPAKEDKPKDDKEPENTPEKDSDESIRRSA